MGEQITPITTHVTDEQLVDLRTRLDHIRWPDGATVADTSQGPTTQKLRALTDRWRDGYDWRTVERS